MAMLNNQRVDMESPRFSKEDDLKMLFLTYLDANSLQTSIYSLGIFRLVIFHDTGREIH